MEWCTLCFARGVPRLRLHVTLVGVAMAFGIMLALRCLGAMWVVSDRLEASKGAVSWRNVGALRECEEGLRHAKKGNPGERLARGPDPLNGIIGTYRGRGEPLCHCVTLT